jgi:hypothetical protein
MESCAILLLDPKKCLSAFSISILSLASCCPILWPKVTQEKEPGGEVLKAGQLI